MENDDCAKNIVENLFSTMYYIEKKKLCFTLSVVRAREGTQQRQRQRQRQQQRERQRHSQRQRHGEREIQSMLWSALARLSQPAHVCQCEGEQCGIHQVRITSAAGGYEEGRGGGASFSHTRPASRTRTHQHKHALAPTRAPTHARANIPPAGPSSRPHQYTPACPQVVSTAFGWAANSVLGSVLRRG